MKPCGLLSAIVFVALSPVVAPADVSDEDVKNFGESKRYAFIVGIREYPNSPDSNNDGVPDGNLTYTINDAKVLQENFEKLGFTKVVLVADIPGQKYMLLPTKENIERELKSLLDEAAGPQRNQFGRNDLFVFCFSGHGLTTVEGRKKFSYIQPRDASPDRSSTWIKLTDVYDEINHGTEEGRRVIVLDACRTETGNPGKGARFFAISPETKVEDFGAAEGTPDRMYVLRSCSRNQYSYEDPRIGHGAFSYNIIQYLKGDAVTSANRFLTVREMFDYTRKRTILHVDNMARLDPAASIGKQEPIYGSNEAGEEWILGAFGTHNTKYKGQDLRENYEFRSLARQGNLKWYDLTGCDLRDMDLSGVDLSSSLLVHANLQRAVLTEAKLHSTKFTRAEMDGANLSNANVMLAKFNNAVWNSIDLSGAKNMRTADFGGTNVTGIIRN
jgi:hypothetical protein